MEKKSTVKHKKLQLTAVLIITDERFEAYEVTTSLPEVIATALSHGSFQHDYYPFLTLCLKKKKKKSIFNPNGGGGFKGKQIYAVDRSISCHTLIYIMAFRQEGTYVAMMLRLL